MKVTLVWLDEAESTLATAIMTAKQHRLADDFSLAIHRGARDPDRAPDSRRIEGRTPALSHRPAGRSLM
jgi:hypothetical protein